MADHPILWVDDPTTRVLTPFWVRFADFWTVRSLITDRPVTTDIPDALRTALAATGALSMAGQRAARAARVNEALDAAAGSFATTDVCMLRHILHPACLAALLDYYEALIASGCWPLGDAQVPGRYGWHNESLSRFFHHQLTDVVSRIAGCPVRPAYSYVSAYRGGAVLTRHVDREQCEFTVSLLLGESGSDMSGGWPLLLESRGGPLSLSCRPGEAIMFRGPTVPHSRLPLRDGGTHTSLLLHYVPAEFRRTLY
ncbi:hypothetical protein MXD62_28925 [Frankia sp. Mgl5]|uniref:hypothetical protein n=1 Tax=Frankia sp. Mgl5 TaxID=2933793 RepID=UPI00200C7BA6|nr:hypothetical protein [Frankia sp. Mgl5]MCK9931118.1 hypothetical protein [Frankia sp. Mgl5]